MSREKSLAKNTIILAIGTVLPKIAHLSLQKQNMELTT